MRKKIGWSGVLVFFLPVVFLAVFLAGRLRAGASEWELTEVMANAREERKGEFFELRYWGENVDLAGWSIEDNLDRDNLRVWSGEPETGRNGSGINRGDLLVIVDPDYANEYVKWWQNEEVDLSRVVVMTVDDADIGNGLNNSGEEFKLYDAAGILQFNIVWKNNTVDGRSWELIGENMRECDLPDGNSIGWVRESGEILPETDESDQTIVSSWSRFWLDGQVPVKLNELMINPVGDDGGEWVEIKNRTDKKVDLTGWYICDGVCELEDEEGGYRIKEGILPPGGFLLVKREESDISLNNGGDRVILFDPNHIWVDAVEYDIDAKEGWSYAFDGEEWKMNDDPSPNEENVWIGLKEQKNEAGEKTELKNDKDEFSETIDLVKDLADKTEVKLSGVAVVDYGVVDANGLWIGDDGGGILLKGGILSGIKKGEEIQVWGQVDSLKYQKIIRAEGMERMGIKELVVEEIKVSDVADYQDRLVRFTGKVIEKNSVTSFVLGDGGSEVKILLKDQIEIDPNLVKKGQYLVVTGVVVLGLEGYKVYPTVASDLKLMNGSGLLPAVGPDWGQLVTWRG